MSADVYAQPLPSLDFGRACKWMFASPNWLANFFCTLICSLLGIFFVGQILFAGYQLEMFQNRIRGQSEGQADFNFDKIGVYFVRGLIPFAINFLLGIGIVLVAALSIGAWALLYWAVFGEPDGLAAIIFVGPIVVLAITVAIFTFFMVAPLCIRGGCMNNLVEGFRFAWAIDTAKRMWPTMLLCLLYSMLLGLLAQVVVVVTCGVGILFVVPWVQLAMTDLAAQAYDIYEAKGGEPIPMDPV